MSFRSKSHGRPFSMVVQKRQCSNARIALYPPPCLLLILPSSHPLSPFPPPRYVEAEEMTGAVTREARFKYAAAKMGNTVLAGAITTAGAGLIMFLCQVRNKHDIVVVVAQLVVLINITPTMVYCMVFSTYISTNMLYVSLLVSLLLPLPLFDFHHPLLDATRVLPDDILHQDGPTHCRDDLLLLRVQFRVLHGGVGRGGAAEERRRPILVLP